MERPQSLEVGVCEPRLLGQVSEHHRVADEGGWVGSLGLRESDQFVGVAIDDTLEQWAEAGRALATGQRSTKARRTVQIDVWDPVHSGGILDSADLAHAYSYLIYNAWISKYNALPKLDASISEVALASVEISHEGWRRTSQPSSQAT